MGPVKTSFATPVPPATGPADSAGIVMNHAKVEPGSVDGIVNSPIITAPPRPSTPLAFIGTSTNKTGWCKIASRLTSAMSAVTVSLTTVHSSRLTKLIA